MTRLQEARDHVAKYFITPGPVDELGHALMLILDELASQPKAAGDGEYMALASRIVSAWESVVAGFGKGGRRWSALT